MYDALLATSSRHLVFAVSRDGLTHPASPSVIAIQRAHRAWAGVMHSTLNQWGWRPTLPARGLMLDKDRWRPPSQNRSFAVPEVGLVAQPDRASAFEAEGCRFAPCRGRQQRKT